MAGWERPLDLLQLWGSLKDQVVYSASYSLSKQLRKPQVESEAVIKSINSSVVYDDIDPWELYDLKDELRLLNHNDQILDSSFSSISNSDRMVDLSSDDPERKVENVSSSDKENEGHLKKDKIMWDAYNSHIHNQRKTEVKTSKQVKEKPRYVFRRGTHRTNSFPGSQGIKVNSHISTKLLHFPLKQSNYQTESNNFVPNHRKSFVTHLNHAKNTTENSFENYLSSSINTSSNSSLTDATRHNSTQLSKNAVPYRNYFGMERRISTYRNSSHENFEIRKRRSNSANASFQGRNQHYSVNYFQLPPNQSYPPPIKNNNLAPDQQLLESNRLITKDKQIDVQLQRHLKENDKLIRSNIELSDIKREADKEKINRSIKQKLDPLSPKLKHKELSPKQVKKQSKTAIHYQNAIKKVQNKLFPSNVIKEPMNSSPKSTSKEIPRHHKQLTENNNDKKSNDDEINSKFLFQTNNSFSTNSSSMSTSASDLSLSKKLPDLITSFKANPKEETSEKLKNLPGNKNHLTFRKVPRLAGTISFAQNSDTSSDGNEMLQKYRGNKYNKIGSITEAANNLKSKLWLDKDWSHFARDIKASSSPSLKGTRPITKSAQPPTSVRKSRTRQKTDEVDHKRSCSDPLCEYLKQSVPASKTKSARFRRHSGKFILKIELNHIINRMLL